MSAHPDLSAVHVSIDLETLGTRPGCVVLSIGLVAFRPQPFELVTIGHVHVDVASQLAAGLTIEERTLAWWQRQRDDAFDAALGLHGVDRPVPFGDATKAVADFFAGIDKPAGVWGYGADFDQPILAALLRAAKTPQPWPYHLNRCGRTLADLTGIKPERDERDRNAFADADAQARAIAAGLVALVGAPAVAASDDDLPTGEDGCFVLPPENEAPMVAARARAAGWIPYNPALVMVGAKVRWALWSGHEVGTVIAVTSDLATATIGTTPNGGRRTFPLRRRFDGDHTPADIWHDPFAGAPAVPSPVAA